MDERRKLFRLGLSGQQDNSAAVAHAHCRSDVLVELKRDALLRDEVDQPLAVLSCIALHRGVLGKLCAFGLAQILSRDLRPARVRHLNRTTPMYCAMAAHGHWDCYGDFHCEESF